MKKTAKRKAVIGAGILVVLSASVFVFNYLGVIQLMSISSRAGDLGWGEAVLDISSNCHQEWSVVNGKPYKYICDLSDAKYGSVAVLSGTTTAIGSGDGRRFYVQDFFQRGDFVTFKTGIVTPAAPNGVWLYYGARWKLNPLPFTSDVRSAGNIINLVPEINGLQYETMWQDDRPTGCCGYFPLLAPSAPWLKRLDGTVAAKGPQLFDETGTMIAWVSYSTGFAGGSCCARFDRIGKDIIYELNGGRDFKDDPAYQPPSSGWDRTVRVWSAAVDASKALPSGMPFPIRQIYQLPADQQRTSDLPAQDQSVTSCPADIQCATNPSSSYTSVHVQTDDFYMDGVTESTTCYAGDWLGMIPCSMLFTGFIRFNDFDGMPVVIPPAVPNSATLYLSAPPVDVNFAIANPYSHLTGLYWPTYYKGAPATLSDIIETIRLKQLSPEELQFEKGMWAGTRVTTWTPGMEQMFGVSSAWLRLHIQVGGSVPANEKLWNRTFGGTHKEFLMKPKVQIGCLVRDEVSAKSWVQHPAECLSTNSVFIKKFNNWSGVLTSKQSSMFVYAEWVEQGYAPGLEPFGFEEKEIVVDSSTEAVENNKTIGVKREGEVVYHKTPINKDDGLWSKLVSFLKSLWPKLRG